MKLYHGTDAEITKFEVQEDNPNGVEFGYGIYFAETYEEAAKYGKKVYEVEVALGKELRDDKLTFTEKELTVLLEDIQAETDYLSNYGDISYEGYSRILGGALDNLMNENSDTDVIGGIIGATDSKLTVVEAVVKLGYTHNKGAYPNGVVVWVILDASRIKNVKKV